MLTRIRHPISDKAALVLRNDLTRNFQYQKAREGAPLFIVS
jgi:hypothetical protein